MIGTKHWDKILVLLTFLISIFLFYSNPDQFVSDNSLFYPVVAENIWTTGVSTFNGQIETYGYQPLWMLVSVLSVALSSFFALDTLMVIGFFYHLFLAGALIVVFKIAKRWEFFSAPVVALIFIFMFISNGVLHNMESAMALFFVLLSIYHALSIKKLTPQNMFILGLLVGLTFLSRLDLIFFGLITTFYTLFIFRKEVFQKPLLLLFYFFGVVLVVLPYLLYNELHFGALLPILGRLAEGFPTLSYAMENIYPYGTVSLGIAVLEWAIAWTAKTKQAREIILIMSLSTIFQIIYVAFFQHPQSWYFITGFINFAVIVGYLLKRMNIEWLTNIVLVVLVVVTIGATYLKTVSNYALSAHILHLREAKVGRATLNFSTENGRFKYARDVQRLIPEGSIVTAGYYPGALAYYAKLHVFGANGLSSGLIANNTYDNILTKYGLNEAMKKFHIEYHIVPATNGAVLWFGRMGFNVVNKDESLVMLYAKNDSTVCGMASYHNTDSVLKAQLGFASRGYAGIFPAKEMQSCPNDAVKNRDEYYSTMINK